MLKKLLATPTAQLGKASRFLVFQIKLWSHCFKLLWRNHYGQQAAALSYHTIFGLVPLAIVILWMFQLFPTYGGIGEKVRDVIYDELHLNIEYADPSDPGKTIVLTDKLDNLSKKFFEGLNEGKIAFLSAVIVLWAAIALLLTIERSFNRVWHVSRDRNFLHRIINYWAFLTLGPLLFGVAIYVTTKYSRFSQLEETIYLGPAIFSYLVATVGFFLLYFVLPNTRVQVRAALWGAAVASLAWSLAKWGFGEYVTRVMPYSQIYGYMGLIPLTVFWIYITWLIVLFGLHLAYTTQNLKSLDAAEIAAANKGEEYFIANDMTVINIVRIIVENFESKLDPIGRGSISRKLDIPDEFCDKVLNHLVASRILIKASEPKAGYVPAQSPEKMTLEDISEAVADAGFGQTYDGPSTKFDQILKSQKSAFKKCTLKQLVQTKKKTQRKSKSSKKTEWTTNLPPNSSINAEQN